MTHDEDLSEEEQDARWEEDCAIVDDLIAEMTTELKNLGFWQNEHEEGRITVRCYARSGYPIEKDTARG